MLVPSLVLLALESYYRFVYDTTDAYQAGLISQRWVSRYYELNNFGVRDDVDYSLEPPKGRTRVTFVGDSCTNGHGVPAVRDRFVNLIRDEHPDWDVQMIAEDGLDTGAILQRLEALKVRAEYRDIHRQLAELWQGVGVPHLDLRESFSKHELDALIVNRHDTHPNDFAHGLAAAEIGIFIESNLRQALDDE